MNFKGFPLIPAMFIAISCYAQYYPYSSQALVNSQGAKLAAFATITICPVSATGNPCNPTATIYSSQTGGTLTNPFAADQNGNFTFWAAPGIYLISITFGTSNQTYPVSIGPVIACSPVSGADVQTCINNLPSAGGQVLVPCGTFSFTSPLTISISNVYLSGSGKECTIFEFTGATDGLVLNASGTLTGVTISDLELLTTNAGGGKAMNISPGSSAEDISISRVDFDISGIGVWQYGVWATATEVSSFYDLRMRSISTGIHLEGNSNSITATGIDIGGTFATGIDLASAEAFKLVGGTVEGAPSNALIQVGNGSGISVFGTHMESSAVGATGIKALSGSLQVSLNGVEMTNSGYATGISIANSAQFTMQGSYVSINASTAAIAILGTAGSSGNPATIFSNFINQTNASAPAVTIDGTTAAHVAGGTIQTSGGDCIKLGASTQTVAQTVENVYLHPGGSGYPVNAVSVTAPPVLLANYTPSGTLINGSSYVSFANTANGSVLPNLLTGGLASLNVNSASNLSCTGVGCVGLVGVNGDSASHTPLVLKMAASQTADGFELQDSATNVKVRLDSSGNLTAQELIDLGLLQLGTSHFANLGSPNNGIVYWCDNCDAPVSEGAVCSSSGGMAGAEAHRIRGSWLCF